MDDAKLQIAARHWVPNFRKSLGPTSIARRDYTLRASRRSDYPESDRPTLKEGRKSPSGASHSPDAITASNR